MGAATDRCSGGKRRGALALTALAAGILALSALGDFSKSYGFAINETESLPNWGFWLDKDVKGMTWRHGDYVAFVSPDNPYYPHNMIFVKKILGVPGDVVSHQGRDVFINGHFVGHAKERSKTGQVAEIGDVGVIPAGRYFVGSDHPDGLDSRYKMIGLIELKRLVGKGTPVM